jgi:hypothetical protein
MHAHKHIQFIYIYKHENDKIKKLLAAEVRDKEERGDIKTARKDGEKWEKETKRCQCGPERYMCSDK